MFIEADRLKDVAESASGAMTALARAIAEKGGDVVTLSQGEPDFPTPRVAIAAAHEAANSGDTKYPPHSGTKALKSAIQRKFLRDNELKYNVDEIIVTNGGKQAIFNALMASVNPGDEVIVPMPSWVSYVDIIKLAGGVPVAVQCPENAGFKLNLDELDKAIGPRTKWVIVNFPNNPTGAAYSRNEMQALAEVLLKHPHVMVMTDDMYEHLLFGETRFCTIAQVEPRLKDRVLTVNGLSKTYAMTGWRIGYAAGPKPLIKSMLNLQGQSTGGVSTVGQAAAAAALDGPQSLLRERLASYQERRDLVLGLLEKAPGLRCIKPDGGFFVFANIAGCLGLTTAGGKAINTDEDFVMALLGEKHVALVHGAAYGLSPYVRLSYATDIERLAKGCERIVSFCRGLK